jgi:hypothetical protein
MKKLILSTVLLALSSHAYSDTAWIMGASIDRMLNQSDAYGECMVYLDKTLADEGLNCAGR